VFREEHLHTDELVLNVARGPNNGPPLVLLHGVTRRWQDYSPVLSEFAARFEIYALDFRGHGKSQRASTYRTIDYVRDAVALVRQVVPGSAVIYGHSLGAMVAAAVAAELPDHVRGLILEDPPWETLGARLRETSFDSLFQGMLRVANAGGSIDQLARGISNIEICAAGELSGTKLGDVRDASSIRFGAACLKQMDPAVLEPLVAGQWLQGYAQQEIQQGIRCPTLLLQADYAAGGMLPDTDAVAAQRRIANSLRVKLDGVGHLMHWLARERLLTVVLGFLESLD
jgi:pimeloyl-ACP methyl ester carboxylesterase